MEGTKMGPKTADLLVLADHRPKPIHAGPKTPRRKRLTVTAIDGLKSQKLPYDVQDPDCPGLLLHIAAKRADGSPGAKSWQWRFYWKNGNRKKLTLGKFPEVSQREAHDRVRAARVHLADGIDPTKAGKPRRHVAPSPTTTGKDGKPADPNSVAALAADFMERFVKPERKRPQYVQRILDRDVLSNWADRDARTIEPTDVIELLNGIVDRGAKTMANRTAAIISQMFKWGIQQRIVKATPVVLMYPPGGTEKPKTRVLSDEELAALLGSLDDVMFRAPTTISAIRIALLTACRRSELVLAKWSDLTLEGDKPQWRIPPENSKTGAECLMPLVPDAVREFRNLKKRSGRSRYVTPIAEENRKDKGDIPIDPKLVTRSLARHLETLSEHGVKAFTLHDLRRTVRTGLSKLKIQPHVAERILNHKQPGIAPVYDVFAYLDEKCDALDKWAAHLQSLLKG
jgi:integrase